MSSVALEIAFSPKEVRNEGMGSTPYGPNKCKLHLITGVQIGEAAEITGWSD
jgi:hypothetical protein